MTRCPPIARRHRAPRRPLRRLACALLGAAALAAVSAGPAGAQDYPSRPIKMIVPYPPGGATDVIGRVMAQKLSTALNQQVVVENRGGAAGNIGAAAVAKSPADGYTLLMGALTSHSINSALYGPALAQFDMNTSFAPIAVVGRVPLVFVVNPKLPANTLAELIALARSKPGVLTIASSGNGSPQHLAAEMFQRLVDVKMVHVPYKGSGPAMTDLIGGQVDTMIETVPAAHAHIKAGKLRALATATATPVPTLPGVPTVAEAGLKGFEVSSMFGVMAPAGTPAPVIARLSDALKEILGQGDTRESMLAQGAFSTWTSPADTGAAIRAEVAMWTKVIRDGNIKPE